MSALLQVTGTLLRLGALPERDARLLAGAPALCFDLDDGRTVTLAGLTWDECRAALPALVQRAQIVVALPQA